MHLLQKTAALTLVFLTLSLTACTPNYASKKEIVQYAEQTAEKEPIELDSEIDKHTYRFRSTERELYFDVTTSASEVIIDGTSFGYSGKYSIYADYYPSVYRYHDSEVEALLQKYEFEEAGRSNEFDHYESFDFVISNSQYSEDIDRVNGFLNDLRAIVEQEQQYHDAPLQPFLGTYIYTVEYQVDENVFQRTAGNYNYSSYIIAGQEIDILHDLEYSMLIGNVIPPLRHGILIYVTKPDDN